MVTVGGDRLKVNYLNMEAMSTAEPGSEELRVFQQLQGGTNVVGGVIPTQEENDFYFLVVRAVEQEGEIVGAVRAEVGAGLLSQQGHDSVLFHSVHRVISGSDGRVVCGSVPISRGRGLTELCLESGLSQREAEKFIAAYHEGESGSFRCTVREGRI